jgi:ABC-type microcin C transport system duplicated ATPase subunit YejF
MEMNLAPDSSSIPLLSLRHICVRARSDNGERTLLQDVSFDILPGHIVALVGESGSGKSLCAQTILNLLPHPALTMTAGEIHFKGERIDTREGRLAPTMRGKRIAMIFQEPMTALNPVHTIGQQLAEVFSLHFPHMSAADIRQRSLQLLQQTGVQDAEQRLQQYPHQLSGGQCQRVMIAMALAGEPELLIADEPSTALDATTQHQLLLLLRRLQQELGMAILFITHDLALASHWCHDVVVMQQGSVCEAAPTATLFQHPQHPYTRALLAAIQPCEPRPARTTSGEVLFDVQHIDKSFKKSRQLLARRVAPHTVLQDVSFTLHAGEVVALVGESGCGKSTLGRALLWLDPPDRGDIYYRGTALASLNKSALRAWRKNVQVIFQDTNESLNPRQTVARILAEPLEIHRIGDRVARERRVSELLALVELPADCANRFPHEFSGGQRQRIGIARAIALQPDVIICDEAVSALDVSTQAQIIALLLRLQTDLGLSLLFITHDLHVVRRVADRVLVMQSGRIVESNHAAHLFADPQHEATRQLLAAAPTLPTHFISPE